MRERGEIGEDGYRRLRAASDRRRDAGDRRRHGRDREPSPYESFDRRRAARDDPPDFMGMPRTGGSMVPNPSSVDRPGFGEPRDPAAKDRRPGFARPRKFGQDAALSFGQRFSFTNRVTDSTSSAPIKIAVG
jgi:hypothetical protein